MKSAYGTLATKIIEATILKSRCQQIYYSTHQRFLTGTENTAFSWSPSMT